MGITNTSQTVLSRLDAGEPTSFRELYGEPIRRMASGCVVRMGVRPQDRQDIIQAVTATVLERAPLCFKMYDRLLGGFKGWLKGMVFHVTHEEVRRQTRQVRRFGVAKGLDLLEADEAEQREDDDLMREDLEFMKIQLREALRCLDDQETAECLRLRAESNVTWEQLAISRGSTAAALRKRASRACADLRVILASNESLRRLIPIVDEGSTAPRGD